MYPIVFSIGQVHVYTHGLFMVVGALIGGLIIFCLAKQNNYNTSILFDLLTYSFLAGLIGARMLYVTLYYNQFANFKEMLFIWYGGLVSYGGMISGLLAAYLILKTKKENILKWFDVGIIGLLVGWGIGRIGCFLNGDSYGILSQARFAIKGRIPTQLLESIWVIIFAAILYWVLKYKERFRINDGVIFWLGISSYSLGRLIIDFLREDSIILFGLKGGQLGSLIILTFSIIMIYKLEKIERREKWY